MAVISNEKRMDKAIERACAFTISEEVEKGGTMELVFPSARFRDIFLSALDKELTLRNLPALPEGSLRCKVRRK